MRIQGKLPELLSPAGDFECLVAAVSAGADAVYIGAKEFSARAYAKNFDISEIDRAVRYCHLFGVRLYVTVNTLLTTSELPRAVELARELYLLGVDALIVSDTGLIRELRSTLPKLEIHASTQLSVHNSAGADAAFEMGCKRVVLARELSVENITLATERTKAETEIFIHGALCVSHSGQCLFSSLVGGRSGNRGECAQPCRLNYNGDKYPLSLKDLSAAMHIPKIIETGVASLKIEGRMKAPSYVYTVTRIYRTLLDEKRPASKDEMKALERAFSRSGFTDGYLTGRLSNMTGTRKDSDIAATRETVAEFSERRAPVTVFASFKLGERSKLTLSLKNSNKSVTVLGDAPEEAKNHPLTVSELRSRLSKMGNTYFSVREEDITVELDEGINLSPSKINALRREAADALETPDRPTLDEQSKSSSFDAVPYSPIPGVSAEFLVPELYFSLDNATRGHFNTVFLPLYGIESYESVTDGVSLPAVVTDTELDKTRALLEVARSRGVKYALVGNIGSLIEAKRAGLLPVASFRMNITNSSAKSEILELGAHDIVLSAELTPPAVSGIGGRAVTYGRIPLMLTERCFISENFGCDKCKSASFTDRRGERFPVIREGEHRNIILNSRLTYMGDKRPEVLKRGNVGEHFIFSTEAVEEAKSAVSAYFDARPLPSSLPPRRMGRRDKD